MRQIPGVLTLVNASCLSRAATFSFRGGAATPSFAGPNADATPRGATPGRIQNPPPAADAILSANQSRFRAGDRSPEFRISRNFVGPNGFAAVAYRRTVR